MSYKINTTNGTLLVDLIDGRIDTDTTDLTLIGRNYTGYGEAFNENFIKVLENFANTSAPENPLTGQLWFDTSESRLKIYDGSSFKSTSSTIVSSSTPVSLDEGELWVDTTNKQLKFSDGNAVFVAGPIYTETQGATGFDVQTYVDKFGNPKTVARLLIGDQPVAIVSKEAFTTSQSITNFGNSIAPGFNISSAYSTFNWHGTSRNALALGGESVNAFLKVNPADGGNTTEGFLHVKDDAGIFVGDNFDYSISVNASDVIIKNQASGSDIVYQVNQGTASTPAYVDYLKVDTDNSRVGIFQSSPAYTLDVNGDARVSGNLVVDGDTMYVNVTDLRVEDIAIELGITDDSTLLTEAEVNGGGIILKATGDDKLWTWSNTNDAWTSSTNIDISVGSSYKINGIGVLTSTQLGDTVATANGLTQIGTLGNLDVDDINLNGSTISTTSNPLIISSNGDITISGSSKILGVVTPESGDPDTTVATKEYVDDKTSRDEVFLTLDITGLSNLQIALVLEDLVPAATKNIGIFARIHCTEITGEVYLTNNNLSKTFVTVDKAGTENQSVLADVGFSNTVPSVTVTVERSLKRFVINSSNQWEFESDLTSRV